MAKEEEMVSLEELDETVNSDPAEEGETTEPIKPKFGSKSTTVLMTVGMLGFFVLYGLAMYLEQTVFNIQDIGIGVGLIFGIFAYKKYQRNGGTNGS